MLTKLTTQQTASIKVGDIATQVKKILRAAPESERQKLADLIKRWGLDDPQSARVFF